MNNKEKIQSDTLDREKYLQKRRESYIRDKDKRKIYLLKNCDRIKEVRKSYKNSNSEKIKSQNKEYRDNHKNHIRDYNREYYINNVENIDRWINQNQEKIKGYKRKYQEKIKPIRGKLRKEKILKNPVYKLEETLRGRLYSAIKSQSTRKSQKTMELLGCSSDFAKKHLESQFRDGMSWDNHSLFGWHIDHIRPCASFDLSDPEQQKECFHYTNLQPLWASENLSKGDKFITAKT